jgi:hypothetical protein
VPKQDFVESVIEMTPANKAEALFASNLQPSDYPSVEAVSAAIYISLQQHGGRRGCEAACAAEYGDHPDTASARMRWALAMVGRANSTVALAG